MSSDKSGVRKSNETKFQFLCNCEQKENNEEMKVLNSEDENQRANLLTALTAKQRQGQQQRPAPPPPQRPVPLPPSRSA